MGTGRLATAAIGAYLADFFSYVCGDHLELHSFPTRRSSDLEVINAGVSGDTSAGGLRRLDWALEGDTAILVVALGGNDGDRKSTRLNSSHGYISYAVFCLKKKIQNSAPVNHPHTSIMYGMVC